MNTQELIKKECAAIESLLLMKNVDYGNSAMEPLRLFSSADPIESINVRIDDKLSRIANKNEKNISEDTALDLIGYLILRRIAIKQMGKGGVLS